MCKCMWEEGSPGTVERQWSVLPGEVSGEQQEGRLVQSPPHKRMSETSKWCWP